jgi:hypothetical protein
MNDTKQPVAWVPHNLITQDDEAFDLAKLQELASPAEYFYAREAVEVADGVIKRAMRKD